MTSSQLTKLNIKTNEWINLGDQYPYSILLSNDTILYTTSTGRQFYFDTTNDLLYVRQVQNRTKVMPGGVKDSKIGIFHEVYDLEDITSIQ